MIVQEIENIIRSLCYVYIQSKEGRTLPTDDIADMHVGGIRMAAEEIVNRFHIHNHMPPAED